jgi:MFS transporter, UMF1 family
VTSSIRTDEKSVRAAATRGDASAPANDVAADDPSGSPVSLAATEAEGWARLFRSPPGLSATGERIGSPLAQVSWAMFDFARTPYVLLVTIYLFAPYFANVVVANNPVRGQAIWLNIQGYSGVIIALLAPFIGAISDAGGRRKPWIVVFGTLVALAAAMLWFAKPAETGLSINALCIYVAITYVAFEFTSVFYNAMLASITTPAQLGGLSGLGLALGNAAGVLLLLLMLYGFALPGVVHWSFIPAHPWFGVSQAAHEPERLTGPISALCIFIFSIPLLIWTPDRAKARMGWIEASTKGIASVFKTIRSLKHYRNVATYILARLFFNDGMTALLTVGGIYAAGTFSWGALEMMIYGIVLSVFAVFGGFFGGWLDDHLGSKAAIFITVGGTVLFGLLSISMGPDRIFWFIPYDPHSPPVHSLPFFRTWPELIYMGIVCFVAVCVSASYANARTMMARISPVERMSEFFGLFSLSGQSTSFFATLSASWLTEWTASQRGGMIAVMIFLGLGLLGMIFVKEERATAA